MTGPIKRDGPTTGHGEEVRKGTPGSVQPLSSSIQEARLTRLLEGSGFSHISITRDEGHFIECSGKDVSLGCEVTVKVLSEELSRDAIFRERFVQQLEVSRRVDSPYVEKVLRIDESGPDVFVVTERIKGRTLEDVVENSGPMGWRDARGVFLQLCDAMEAIHARLIVHRLLTPRNVAIEEGTGVLKVLDFTFAKLPPGSGRKFTTLDGSVIGCPEYMSPEIAYGRKFDHRSDIYAMGSVMYHVLCGKPPFERDMEQPPAESWMEIGLKIIHEPPVPLSEKAPSVPEKVSDIVMKCLAKDAAERFQSVSELREAIERC